jgi:hypothetical protein
LRWSRFNVFFASIFVFVLSVFVLQAHRTHQDVLEEEERAGHQGSHFMLILDSLFDLVSGDSRVVLFFSFLFLSKFFSFSVNEPLNSFLVIYLTDLILPPCDSLTHLFMFVFVFVAAETATNQAWFDEKGLFLLK